MIDPSTILFYEKVTPDFAAKVVNVATSLNVDPNWLMLTMNIESGLNPAAKNPASTATGLIQFLEGTAEGLGTTTAALAQMSALEQLDYVQQYYQGVIDQHGQLDDAVSVYCAVFYPAAIQWSYSQEFPQNVYAANSGLDHNGDGTLTKQDISDFLSARLPAGFDDVLTTTNKYMNRIIFAGGCLIVIFGLYLIFSFKPF